MNEFIAIRVARWLYPNYRTLAVPVSVAQNIGLLTHALLGITIIFTPDKIPESPVKNRTPGNRNSNPKKQKITQYKNGKSNNSSTNCCKRLTELSSH